MSREEATALLKKKHPNLKMEIEEFLSFEDTEDKDEADLLEAFDLYMER